jgi:isoquinoline 1-oxidoreductase
LPEPQTLNPEPLPDSEPERYELRETDRYRFNLDRRDVLKALGGGVLVCLVFRGTSAQQRGKGGKGGKGGGNTPQQLGAWLHIGEDGQLTLYSGKTEVGQNVRTSVTQALAEELQVSPTAVRVVLADTDLVPNEGGTSGSRSTPSTIPQIRRVGAAAREVLIDLAAEQLKADRNELVAADGKVAHPQTGRSLSFGELTKGQKLTKTVSGTVALTAPEKWKVLGTSTPKVDARAIVTGTHKHTPDVQLPGMLHGKVLRSKAIGAKLESVNLKDAAALPGVVAIHDGDFVGVAAPTAAEAEKALAAIRAAWSPPASPASGKTLFADLKKTSEGGIPTNDALEAALKAADHRLETTFTIAYIAHAPLEPRAAVAEWKDGKLTVWTGTQQPFGVRDELSRAFSVPADRVRVIVPDTGSGYGGKHRGDAALEAARLAKAAGKPVKLVWTREEEFTWAYFRPAGVIDVRAGVRKDGTLVAWDFHNYNSGQSAVRGLYDVPQKREQYHSSNSPLRQGSYRALASTANTFARESHIDDLAHAVGMDPLEFRLKNLKDERLRAVLEAAAKQFAWTTLTRRASEGTTPTRRASEGNQHPGHGFGIAGGSEKGSYVASCAEVARDPASGKIRVVRVVTAFECGAVLHPEHLKNQVEGAVVQGLGGALFEAIQFDNGEIKNAAFSAYRVPRFADTPVLETVLLDRKDLAPIGAGETPIIAVAPAVGNAIFQATGVRARSLPISSSGVKV